MKSYLLISILILSLKSIHASSPQIEAASGKSVTVTAKAYSNGVYYFHYGDYYNTTSGHLYLSGGLNSVCEPSFTLDAEPFCIIQKPHESTKEVTFSLVFLRPNLTEITAEYELATLPDDNNVNAHAVQDYIVIGLNGYTYPLGTNFTLMIFELSTKTFLCTKQDLKFDHPFYIEAIYSNGSFFVYSVVKLDITYSSYFVTGFCSSNVTTISPAPSMYESTKIEAFNDSSLFVNYFISGTNPNAGHSVQIGVYNSSNQLNFGPAMVVKLFKTYNDTHMFIDYVESGVETFGLFVISPALEFVKVASFYYGLYIPIDATPIIGTNDALITLGDQAAFITYSFNSNSIIQVGTPNSPIILSNGSVVKISQYGYFIQSPGEPFYFVQAPYSSRYSPNYQDPSDSNQTYTLFVPSLLYNTTNVCILTHYNASSSVITRTTLPVCPLSDSYSNPINIKDVKYASDGTLYVCYRDSLASLYIVNSAGGSFSYFKNAFNTYGFLEVSMNLTNGTANFAATQLTSFVLGKFNITSGQVLITKNLVSNSFRNVITKLTDRYFLLVFTAKYSSKLSIYDMVGFNRTNRVTVDVNTSIAAVDSFWPFGFSEENPTTFAGVIFVTQDNIFAVNFAGYCTTISNGGALLFSDVVFVNETSFVVTKVPNDFVFVQENYEIKSWGNENKSLDHQIEIESSEY